MNRCVGCLLIVAGMGYSIACAQSEQSWPQLSLSTCKVDEFLKQQPNSDGRGVVIAVLDTGVDPSIPGLTQTPDGETKVIDVQDFSGQGDIELHRVQREGQSGKIINYKADGSPIEYEPPTSMPASDEERLYWFGFFDERKFVNSDVPDLNDNGTTDDQFAVLVTALAGDGDDQAMAWVDTDVDRSFAGETLLRNYKLHFDTFTLHRRRPEEQMVPVTFAVNIFLRQSKIVVHYDDGAHGTHVAGIAAGYRINNQEGFNGIAPGAKVISLKISQNARGALSTTGSIKRAIEYAAGFSRERGVPVVCNLSFGVDSVIEGFSDIDEVLDDILRKNPYLVFCTSAGNAGPGLSTVGTPAAAAEAITVAAMQAADTAREVRGFEMGEAVVTAFSARGGEVDKPDLAAPGWSTSTVPRYITRGDYWSGTSMASPYITGLCALLISNAKQHGVTEPIRKWDVHRALAMSAEPVPRATALSSGWGKPNLLQAGRILQELIRTAKDDPVIGYDISTPCPHGYNGRARAAYWRSTYLPAKERQDFTIKPVFAPGTDGLKRTDFTRKYQLRSKADWCKITQSEVYLHSEQDTHVYVEYDEQKLKEPGLYVGSVEAWHDDQLAFRLMNSVIVPYRATAASDYRLSFENQLTDGWHPNRYFVAVPPGASAMQVKLSVPIGKESKASIERIYDPTGRQLRDRSNNLDTMDGKREVVWNVVEDLIPGVWELPMVSDRPDKQWPFDLHVKFLSLHPQTNVISDWSGSPPEGALLITNLFEESLTANAQGMFEGFRLWEEDAFEGLKDELSYSLTVDEAYDRVRFDLEMTPEAYATTTDIGVYVEIDGEEIHSDAFENRSVKGEVKLPEFDAPTEVKLIIRGGFAVADDTRKTPITVKFDQLLAEAIPVEVSHGDSSVLRFVPSVPMKIGFALENPPPATPDGLLPVGYLNFHERATKDLVLHLPIEIVE